jgi:hypothetical protein
MENEDEIIRYSITPQGQAVLNAYVQGYMAAHPGMSQEVAKYQLVQQLKSEGWIENE